MSRSSEGSSQPSDVFVFGRGGVLQVRVVTAELPRPKSNLPPSLPSSPPLLPPPDRLWRNGGGRGCEKEKRPAELRVQAHQCARVWLVMFCYGLSKEFFVWVTHDDAPWRGSDCPACKKSPEDGTMAPVNSAFRVMLCRAAVTRLKEKQKAIRSCQFCLRWANTFCGSHSTF